MVNIQKVDDINKIMRASLIENSEVCNNSVRDIITEFGVDLDKNYTNSIFHGLSANDVAVLYELNSKDTDSNMSETVYGGVNIKYYQYYEMKVIMYGDNSTMTALKTIARLRSAEVRDSLIGQGIHISSVSETSKNKEFINGVVWQRNDFTINLACEMTITPIKSKYEIEGYSKLDIYKK